MFDEVAEAEVVGAAGDVVGEEQARRIVELRVETRRGLSVLTGARL